MKGWTLARKHDPGAEIESWPQQRVGQIRVRFIDGADAVKPGRRRSSETAQLRKDEPHPVGPLRPARNSASTVSKTGACAVTKRSRLERSADVISALRFNARHPIIPLVGSAASSSQAGHVRWSFRGRASHGPRWLK